MGLIRFYLAVSVVLAHNAINVPGISGHLAVMAFFVISGFYMGLVLNERYRDRIATFYVARFFRLWPMYIVVFLVTAAFIEPVVFEANSILVRAYFYFVVTTSLLYDTLNWFAIDPGGSAVFLETTRGLPGIKPAIWASHMPHMWSIGVELTFYAFAPLFARNAKRCLIVFVLAYALHLYMTLNMHPLHPLVRRSALNFFWLFALGVLSYWAWRNLKSRLDGITITPVGVALTTAALTGICIAGAQRGWAYSSGLGADPSLVLFAVVVPVAFHFTRKSTTDRLIGELSYPIYLVHWPIVALLIIDHRADWGWSLIITAISIACAVALYLGNRRVERYRTWLKAGHSPA